MTLKACKKQTTYIFFQIPNWINFSTEKKEYSRVKGCIQIEVKNYLKKLHRHLHMKRGDIENS